MHKANTKKMERQICPSSNLTFRFLNQDEWLTLGDEWEALVDNLIEENVYLHRQYVEALLEHIETRPVTALTIWEEGQLMALLPFVEDNARWLGASKLNTGWITDYSPFCLPLIHQSRPADTVRALLDAIEGGEWGDAVWAFPTFRFDGPVGELLLESITERGRASRTFDTFERAIMTRKGDFETHRQTVFSRKRRKELERLRKRLNELGTLETKRVTEGPALELAIDKFLRIEASGWKGKSGSALASDAATRAFAHKAYGAFRGRSITAIDFVLLDGKAIAAEVTLLSGRTGFTIKCAYDETYRSQGIGLIMFENMIKSLLEEDWADRVDSAADGGHLINAMWNDKAEMGDLFLAAAKPSLPFSWMMKLEAVRRTSRETIKSLYHQIKPY